MKDIFWKLRYSVVMLLLGSVCTFAGCGQAMEGPGVVSSGGNSVGDSLEARTEKVLASMSLTEKVGQMVMFGFYGTDVNEDVLYMLHQFHMGGAVLFARNVENREQVARLTKHLQEQAEEKVPLFIAVDEEGGMVAHMGDVMPVPPSQQAIGDSGDPAQAGRWAQEIARQLKAMGLNMNFAPVADVGFERERSYSTDPKIVTDFIKSAAEGYEKENLYYTLKHFPGIGKGKVDSHYDISDIESTVEELEADELLPFRAVIEGHPAENFAVMVTHIKYPKLDAQYPASFSRAVITGLLRERMGYQGVVITDDLEMGAVSRYYTPAERGVLAVKAGADIVMICHEYQHAQEMYLGILDAVKAGEISEERIHESVRRIVRMKLSRELETRGK